MTHLVRRRTDREWGRGYHVTGADMAFIDENTRKAINGDEGQAVTSSSKIAIAGAGVGISGPWVLLTTASVQTNGTTHRIVFGEKSFNDAWVLAGDHADRVKDLLQPISIATAFPSRIGDVAVRPTANNNPGPTDRGPWVQASRMGARFWTPIRVHDTSTIQYVRLSFRVTKPRAAEPAPEFATRFRVVRVDANGVIEALRAHDSTTDHEGFQSPRPVDGTAWYATGVTQTMDYTPTRFADVDVAKYIYLAEIIEEDGANGGTIDASNPPENGYISTVTRCSNIVLLANRR